MDTDTTPPTTRATGIALMLAGGLSNQTGAAIGALAFPVIGPLGVVAIRQWVAGVILLAAARPRLRTFTWPQWWPVLTLAAVFATMNLSLYTAIDRLGLGLAVTLEFLGPLAVALTASRRPTTLACAALAVTGVAILTRPQPTTDYLGIFLALLAAACWAAYILLNRTIGRRTPGTAGSAAAGTLSALLYIPIGITALTTTPPTPTAITYAATAGLLSSAIPYLFDLLALRRVPTHFFSIFMSINPVVAAAIGTTVLNQPLTTLDCLATALIVTANTIGVLATQTPASTVPRIHQTSPD